MPSSSTWVIVYALLLPALAIPSSIPSLSAISVQDNEPGATVTTNIQTRVSVDSLGDVHVLWAVPALNASGVTPGLWYSKYDPKGTMSISPTLIRNSSFVQSGDMAIDKSGNAHIVWVEDSNISQSSQVSSGTADVSTKLYYGKVNSTDLNGFHSMKLGGTEGLLMWPSLVIDNNQTSYVVWTGVDVSKHNAVGLYYGIVGNNSIIDQITSIASYNVSGTAPPKPYAAYDASSGNLHVAWTERAGSQSSSLFSTIDYARLDLRSKMEFRLQVASENGLLSDATTVPATRGNAYVVWESGESTVGSRIVHVAQISGAGKINFVKQLTNPSQVASVHLAVSTDSQDSLYAIWYQPTLPSADSALTSRTAGTNVSYLKVDNDGSLSGSWSSTVPEPVLGVTVTDSGDLYAVSQNGIIRVPAPGIAIGLLVISILLSASGIGFVGVSSVEDFRYRFIRSFAQISSRRNSTQTALTEDQKVLSALSHNPGVRVRDLREFVPQHKLSMIKMAVLELQGQVSSVRTGLHRRFYCASHFAKDPTIMAYDAIASRIVHEIENNPGIWEARLSQNLGLSQQIVHYHLRKLQAAGFLNAKFEGKRKRYSLAGAGGRRETYEQADRPLTDPRNSAT